MHIEACALKGAIIILMGGCAFIYWGIEFLLGGVVFEMVLKLGIPIAIVDASSAR